MVDRTSATIEHTTDFGLKVRNVTQYANYDRMYQDIYPGGPYDPNTGLVPIIAYNNIGDRENLFNRPFHLQIRRRLDASHGFGRS